MGFINREKAAVGGFRSDSHTNWMGGASYDIKNPIVRLRIAASSCFFGEPMYYHKDASDKRPSRDVVSPTATLDLLQLNHLATQLDRVSPEKWRGMKPVDLMEQAIDEAIAHSVEDTLKEAARLRTEDNIRTTPQVILVRAAVAKSGKGNGLIRKYAKEIIQRSDEPTVGLAYFTEKYTKEAPIPNSLKKAWRDALQRFSEYSLAKYKMESRASKLVDVMNIVHPKGPAIEKLAKGELKMTDTWESIVSAKGSTKETWEEALKHMGHMALLRNLRNLLDKGVEPSKFVDKLKAGVAKGRQLPFRYYSAFRAIESTAPPTVTDAIEQCMKLATASMPQFPGRVMSLCDNSGSARGATTSKMGSMQVSSIANLSAVLTGICSEEGYIGVFGDKLKTLPVRKEASIFDQVKAADQVGNGIGQGTENGVWLFWDQAIRGKEHWDYVFIYSDMQAGHGGLYGIGDAYKDFIFPRSSYTRGGAKFIDVPKLINKYRKDVNPNVQVFLIQVAGYQDTIVPEHFNKTYILGGWSDGVLRFAAQMSGLTKPPAESDESEEAVVEANIKQ